MRQVYSSSQRHHFGSPAFVGHSKILHAGQWSRCNTPGTCFSWSIIACQDFLRGALWPRLRRWQWYAHLSNSLICSCSFHLAVDSGPLSYYILTHLQVHPLEGQFPRIDGRQIGLHLPAHLESLLGQTRRRFDKSIHCSP